MILLLMFDENIKTVLLSNCVTDFAQFSIWQYPRTNQFYVKQEKMFQQSLQLIHLSILFNKEAATNLKF